MTNAINTLHTAWQEAQGADEVEAARIAYQREVRRLHRELNELRDEEEARG